VFNLLQTLIPSRNLTGLLNMSASLSHGRWTAELFVENLLDQSFALTADAK